MIAKQDRVQARTPAQLEQEYNFGRVIKSADTSNLVTQIQQLNQTLSQFMVETNGKLDGTIQAWFYSGVPTLTNQPASQWIADGTAPTHIGDMYYNTDDGSIYMFNGENEVYSWIKLHGAVEKANYNVIFYNENNVVIAGYTIAQGDAINPPVTNVNWVDSNGDSVTFPYVPKSDTKLYISNEESTL